MGPTCHRSCAVPAPARLHWSSHSRRRSAKGQGQYTHTRRRSVSGVRCAFVFKKSTIIAVISSQCDWSQLAIAMSNSMQQKGFQSSVEETTYCRTWKMCSTTEYGTLAVCMLFHPLSVSHTCDKLLVWGKICMNMKKQAEKQTPGNDGVGFRAGTDSCSCQSLSFPSSFRN